MVVLPFRLSVIISIAIVLMSVFLFIMMRDTQSKEKYEKVTGKITFIDKTYQDLPPRQSDKFRYIQLNNYPYVFELYIGKDWGDLAPEYEQIDQLKKGDIITVYEYESSDITHDGVNRDAKFIDKDNVSYFRAGNSRNILLIIMIFICLLMIAGGYYEYKKKKILL